MNLRPLIWTPAPASPQPVEELAADLESVRLYYAAYGYDLTMLPPAVEQCPLTSIPQQPWAAVWGALQGRFVANESILVLLEGWDDWVWGWGGYPLAVVGDGVLRALRTRPNAEYYAGRDAPHYATEDEARRVQQESADALMDDFKALGAIAHEVGHCLGFQHNFTSHNIMSAWWIEYPDAPPSPEMLADSPANVASAAARSVAAAARRLAARGVLEACPVLQVGPGPDAHPGDVQHGAPSAEPEGDSG